MWSGADILDVVFDFIVNLLPDFTGVRILRGTDSYARRRRLLLLLAVLLFLLSVGGLIGYFVWAS